MNYFLGIDVGSSKTHALIVDESGTCVGFGRAGGGNHQGAGYERTAEVMQQSFARAKEMAGVDAVSITAAGFGVAGYDFPSDQDGHLRAVASLGLSCPVEIVNDGWNGLFAGATRGIGVNVTAGSSNNCRGRGKNGKQGRIVGNGITFGEYGGAVEIMARGLQMVNYAWIKRIETTVLTRIYLDATGAKDEVDLMEGLSSGQYHLFPSLAVQVIDAAHNGDEASHDVVEWAGEELGWLAIAVARQIDMQDDEVEIIQSGSVFDAGEILTDSMQYIIMKHCPQAKIIRLDGPPVVGAVILGMEQVNFNGYAVRDNIIRTAKELVN